CRSVLGPAAYFADLLMFLSARKTINPALSVKDKLFKRRSDLGFLELNCANALTPLPYIDVVCEVLEEVVDVEGANDLELTGFTTQPVDETTVAAAFAANKISLGADFFLSQLSPSAPDRWVIHGDEVTYLLKKKAPSPHFFAEVLRNTKASAAELRAYPQYVNPKVYEKLRTSKYPFSLPFDLFAEEVGAAFQKTNLQRWDLMRTFQGHTESDKPTEGDLAAEYFGISGETTATLTVPTVTVDEKRLILLADTTESGQRAVWGEVGNAAWLDTLDATNKIAQNSLCNLKNFLQKTRLEYNELLSLLDLKFINPTGDITVHHHDSSCDTGQKFIQNLDLPKLDRIHRFLRLWRKLKGWKMWELDLVIRHIGKEALDEPFLIKLFYFSQLKNRLGGKTTVEQVCALFNDLNTETRFTQLHEKREDALYQRLFLNKRLINPIDPAFEIDSANHEIKPVLDPVTGLTKRHKISEHHPAILAALDIQEAELVLFKELAKVNDELTLTNLSFLWRHAWLSKLLKFKPEEWATLLKLFQQGSLHFANPKASWTFVEQIDQLKATGFTVDELNWLLAASHSAKAATKELDAARFLTTLRKELQAIQAEYDSDRYDVLTATPPTDVTGLTSLLTTMLQKLNRDEATISTFLKTLRGSVLLEESVQELPVDFVFPDTIVAAPNHIPIQYDKSNRQFRFKGLMSETQRETLLNANALAALRKSAQREDAKLEAAVQGLPPTFAFPSAITGAPHNIPIEYDKPKQLFRFKGLMTEVQQEILLNDTALRLEAAVQGLPPTFAFPSAITGAPHHIPIEYDKPNQLFRFQGLMTEAQREMLLNDATLAAVAENPAYRTAIEQLYQQSTGYQTAIKKLYQQSLIVVTSYQTAIEALYQQSFKAVTDYLSMEVNVALPESFVLPASITGAPHNIPIRLENGPMLYFTDVMTDDQHKILLNDPSLAAVKDNEAYREAINELFKLKRPGNTRVKGLPTGFTFPATITGAPHNISIRLGQLLYFTGVMTKDQHKTLLADSSLAVVKDNETYRKAIEEFFSRPRMTIKFFEPVFTAPLATLPPAIDFTAQLPADLAAKINYDIEQRLLRFTGIMSDAEQSELNKLVPNVLPADVAYHTAVASLKSQSEANSLSDDRIWLTDNDLDVSKPTNDSLAKRMANAIKKALNYLAKTLAANAVVQQSSAQLGLTEALTRSLLDNFAIMPPIPPDSLNTSLLRHLTRVFAHTTSAVDYAAPAMKSTFDGWFWANRVAAILKKWQITLVELDKITVLTDEAQLLKFLTLPLNEADAIAPIDLFLRTSRLLRFRNTLPETVINLLEVLEKLHDGTYAAASEISVQNLSAGFNFPDAITADPHHIPIRYDEANKVFRFTGMMSAMQKKILLTDGSLVAVTANLAYQDAIEQLYQQSLPRDFFKDVQNLNDTWLAANVEALVASIDLEYPKDYLLAESWERIRRAFYFLDNLNAGAYIVQTFAAPAMSDTHAKTLKELLRAKLDMETWLTLSTEIQDVLRERKRDALATFILTQLRPTDVLRDKWENTNHLYAYYLLDVEMSSCQLTSRLVQASGSIQLFVQRCFMGLESDVKVKTGGDDGDNAWRWWKWMRKYRVWEANRKVFLWPENWIEPELKKDRSPFFKDLENELLQNEVNQYTVETAFTNYLEKLDGVAQLEIAGFYQEDDGDNAIIHVFGRTKKVEPHFYYYRRYDYRQWTPWEKVDLDIQGDYLIPVVVNQRLFLFWPVFTEIPDENGNKQVSIPNAFSGATIKKPDDSNGDSKIDAPPTQTVDVQKTRKKLRLQLAVSDYRQGKWTPKKISKDSAESDSYEVEIAKKYYKFLPTDRSMIDGRFGIQYEGHSYGSDGQLQAYLSGAFEISGCKGVPELVPDLNGFFFPSTRPERASVGDNPLFMRWIELDTNRETSSLGQLENDFTLENFLFNKSSEFPLTIFSTTILEQTPWLFTMSPPWHSSYFDRLLDMLLILKPPLVRIERPLTTVGSWLPFFYNDKKRTFFVLPLLWQSNKKYKLIQVDEGIKYYYPEIKQLYRQQEEQAEERLQTFLSNIDLSTMSSVERQNLEQRLRRLFSEEAPPPYTDEQVKELIKRSLMNQFRYSVGIKSFNPTQRRFHFKNDYHPFACDFAKLVYNPLKGIPALMSRETQLKNTGFSFKQSYVPTGWVIEQPTAPNEADAYPKEMVDFTPDGAYSCYNWELFFHIPLLIANSLSKNQRFEEARDWYHFIFNPIGVESTKPGDPAMSKYWITKPFFETTDKQYVQQRIDNILHLLAGDTSVPGFSAQLKKNLEAQVLDWRTNPFEPHRIANYRTVAYQKTVVMRYLDNLIAWGDYLFRQDSMESVNEAMQLYILAAEILGPSLKKIPPQEKPPLKSFNELEQDLDAFSNALLAVENLVPVMAGNNPDGADPAPLPMFYFCTPQNDKMLEYWDTVADRLYKIRHCMNIEGVVRQLALFEPPIDPGALVKAVAGGLDISSALADLNAPLPCYRFNVLLQKANEVCNDVKALGSALLAALEKKDAEALNLLRQGQEIQLLEAVKTVRENQIEEATENLEGLKKNQELITLRRNYYQNIAKINASESLHQDELYDTLKYQQIAQVINVAASTAHVVPNYDVGAAGVGGSPRAGVTFGGSNVGSGLQAAAGAFSFVANIHSYRANKALTNASYERRWDDWKLQERLANKELEQIDKSIAAADLRLSIANKELTNHLLQIENSKATDAFMRSKYTHQELYQWQVGQISGVYFQSYKLAYDLAKRAEQCFRFELGLQESRYINFGYWDSLKKGLLAGEKLQYDLRRLENAYLEQNRREFELTKPISLALLDPLALVKLRETGRCFFQLPEEIFDLDYPGHYFRRIKSVSITLPCIVGPYSTISCTLRLLKNSIRINTANGTDEADRYSHNTDGDGLPADDTRFIENNIAVKAIAASNAQNDSGMFEVNFRDERYLPFEGAGVISEWSLELFCDLPANNPDPRSPDFGKPLRQFDYDSISDTILHIRYTAREDAGIFKNNAISHLRQYFNREETTPAMRLFNLRQEFPTQWYRFLNPTNPAGGNVFELELSPNLFPIMDEGKTLKVNKIWLLARCTDNGSYEISITHLLPLPAPDLIKKMTLVKSSQYGGLHFSQTGFNVELTPTDSPIKWEIKMNRSGTKNLQKGPDNKVMEVEDVLLILGYERE
ncbi:MAG: 5-hydroxyisourate hydrolase, partial [Gammaproteobacteria bacterium]|nr:5-hydroxyisourate hydrolase [Gammaproteobacteria bacterium]